MFAEKYERDPEHPNWILFPRDVEWRKSLYPAEAISHPAKMVLNIIECVVEHYGRPGMTILDPFAGTGTTALAATMGDYTVTLIELETVFQTMLRETRTAWIERGLIRPEQLMMMFGDCRQVLPQLGEKSVDIIITSPPYSVTAQVGKEVTEFTGAVAQRKAEMRRYGSSESHPLNIGRLNKFQFNMHIKRVYELCYRVLKPGGLYVSVTKDSMLAGVRQMLSMDVVRVAGEAGLEYTGDWYKWRAPGGLFQNIMRSKGAVIAEDEDIIVLRRPL